MAALLQLCDTEIATKPHAPCEISTGEGFSTKTARRNPSSYGTLFGNAGMAELADAADSKSADSEESWGFNSPSRHQLSISTFDT